MNDGRASIEVGSAPPRRHFTHAVRVGFVSSVAPLTPNTVSGMPWNAREALLGRGAEIVTLLPRSPRSMAAAEWLSNAAPGWTRYRDYLLGRLEAVNGAAERWLPALTYPRLISQAKRQSGHIRDAARRGRFDALIGVCSSGQFYALETDLPIIYFSDATAEMTLASYPSRMNRGAGYTDAWHEIERVALRRATVAVFPSREAVRSAVDTYGLPVERSSVVATGANVVPEPGTSLEPRAPENRNVRLCIVASDPVRKRVDFAISVTAELVRRNWSAKLVFIGAPFEPAATSPYVECIGQLQLSDPTDRTRHSQILATSHLMLLPTMGEAFSIATMEAAHFARPSVVTNTGGMPTQIDDGATGLVMPTAATPSDWADAIGALLSDSARYETMCRAAYAKASSQFTWLEWGNRISAIIDEAIAARPAGRRQA